jgi:hypothetical protein
MLNNLLKILGKTLGGDTSTTRVIEGVAVWVLNKKVCA